MKTICKDEHLILIPEDDKERLLLSDWKTEHCSLVFALASGGEGLCLRALGEKEEVDQEPINVRSHHPDPQVALISNFADTPFVLDEQSFASVEGFWQSLKFEGRERQRVAGLVGHEARKAGQEATYGPTIHYEGEDIPTGTWWHWQLMKRACEAKFSQHLEARLALLSTGTRPLTHKMRKDSKSIPGVIMAEIWMKIRTKLQQHPIP